MPETDNMLSIKWLAIIPVALVLTTKFSPAETSVSSCEYTVLDVETTGLSPSKNRIIEMSAIRLSGTNFLSCKTWLINPETDIPARSSRIHGISQDMVKAAPVFKEVASEILQRLSNTVIVAHNARFDWGFISAELTRSDNEIPALKIIDSIPLTKHCFPDLASYSMKNLSTELKLATTPTHRAESDTRALSDLFVKCLNVVGTKAPIATLDAFQLKQKKTDKVPSVK